MPTTLCLKFGFCIRGWVGIYGVYVARYIHRPITNKHSDDAVAIGNNAYTIGIAKLSAQNVFNKHVCDDPVCPRHVLECSPGRAPSPEFVAVEPLHRSSSLSSSFTGVRRCRAPPSGLAADQPPSLSMLAMPLTLDVWDPELRAKSRNTRMKIQNFA